MRGGQTGRKEREGIRWHKRSRREGRDGYSDHPGVYPRRQWYAFLWYSRHVSGLSNEDRASKDREISLPKIGYTGTYFM